MVWRHSCLAPLRALPNSLLSYCWPCFCHPVSFLTCCFTKDGVLKKRCLRLPRLSYFLLPASCPSHLTLPALCSLTISKQEVPKLFHPCGIGRLRRRKRRRRGMFQERSLSWHWCWHLAYGAPSLEELDPLCISLLHCSEIIFPVPQICICLSHLCPHHTFTETSFTTNKMIIMAF